MAPLPRALRAHQFFQRCSHARTSQRSLASFSAPSPPPTSSPPPGDNRIRIVEVGPRDGLQNERAIIPLATKLELIKRLARTGLRDIEAGAFVSPKWVPQMADSSKILEYLLATPPPAPHPINYPFLIPNLKGLESALEVCRSLPQPTTNLPPTPPPSPPPRTGGAPPTPARLPKKPTELSIFLSATESFSQRNLNRPTSAVLASLPPLIALATAHGIPIRAYISVVLGCPYEGPHVPPTTVAALTTTLLSLGCAEISLGDTTGMGTPPRTAALFAALKAAGVAPGKVAAHFHDTYGMALANLAVALEAGVRVFDASVAGLGGCPYARGATGNVATEEVVYWAQGMGMDAGGVDLVRLAEVGEWVSALLGRENGSRVGKAVLAKVRDEGYTPKTDAS